MLNKTILAVFAVFMTVSVGNAATFSVHWYENGDSFIRMDGETKTGDKGRLEAALERTIVTIDNDTVQTFSGHLFLAGPGGNAVEGIRVADFVRDEGFHTIVDGDNECLSACSLIWMAGGLEKRWLTDNGKVGYHFAYHTNVKEWEKQKDLVGWIGIQNQISKRSHYYTAQLLKHEVINPAYFVYMLSLHGSTSSFYYVTTENVNEYVGGKVY